VSESMASQPPVGKSPSSTSFSSSLRPKLQRPQQQPQRLTASPPLTWSCAGTLWRHQRPGPSRRYLRPQCRCLHRPPPTNQTHKTLADDLLKVCICPT
jgi:hypothetical protein